MSIIKKTNKKQTDMKKYLMMLALASVSVTGMAQEELPEQKYSVATNSFWSNWFVTAGFQYGASYSAFERSLNPRLANSPFKDFRQDLGASVSIGKWFTPGMGLRTKGTYFFKGHNATTEEAKDGEIKFMNIQEQALFNLHNLICGYNANRFWNFIPYFGAGLLRNFTENENSVATSFGLLNTFRLNKNIGIQLDLSYNLADYEVFAHAADYGNTVAKTDHYFAAEIGLLFNIGKSTWDKVPDVDALKALSQSQIDALNAQLADEQSENARLQQLLKNQKPVVTETKTVTVKEVMAAPVSVFFNIGKSNIASRKDLQNVKDLANIAKQNGSKIVVTGYADSQTGSATFNQQLSQKRADVVANELVKMGVNRDNIEVVAAGGVDVLNPQAYNRRATVAIK
jgi:outer membrane protein OmpA-like peptidoglycan-associated protein